MPSSDQSYPTDLLGIRITDKISAIDDTIVSMSCDQRAFTFVKDIVPELIKIRFARNNLYFSIASIKKIIGYEGMARGHGSKTISKLNGLCTRSAFGRPWTEIVIRDLMIIVYVFISGQVNA